MSLQGYYNRFSAADRYDELLFRASKGLQSAELNEIQSVFSDRLQKIANVLFRDGSVVRGASAAIDAQTGYVQMESGAVYVLGAVREVAASNYTIPTTGDVQIGVRVVTETITELESPALRDPAVGTRNYQESGAGRTRRTVTWAWNGDGGTGDFYTVYAVRDGVLLNQEAPPQLDGVKQLLARYDRDANGNYIVNGLNLFALGKDNTQTNYVFSVQEGVANVEGNKIDKPQASPLSFGIDPDLQTITNEPKVSTGTALQTISLNRKPLNNIMDVVITAEETVTMTHGSFTGALDALPNTAVLSIEEVKQGTTTFQAGTSYNLTADQVDWSPNGPEPAPGSTYTVTYRFLKSVTPTNINADAGTFQIQGAVANTLVLNDYRWKMPRFDAIVLDREGVLSRVKGVPSAFNPIRPGVSDVLLQLASIYHDWISTKVPRTFNDGTRVVSMKEQRQIKESVIELYNLVADERLQRDISSKEPTAKYGVFTDPLFDDDLRDAGVEQDAVIVGQDLQLAISGTPVLATLNNTATKLLPSTDEVLIGQELRTGEMKINPYQSFDPMPAAVVLNPALDLYTVTENATTFATQAFVFGSGSQSSTSTSTVTTLVSESRSAIEFLRATTVNFSVSGFGPNEGLSILRFDGRNITPSGVVANLSGSFSGSFTVPPNVPAGSKLVEFIGVQGSFGSAVYTGQGTLLIRNFRQTTTTTTTRWNPPPPAPRGPDPLAQSFTLQQSRHIKAIDLKFAVKGANKPVQVQIRESSNGFPTETVIAQTIIQPNEIVTTNTYVRASFSAPVYLVGGVEYFIVLLTDDANHAVRVAELGKYDSTAARWVTAQPYTIGVLLSSSNNVTWTAHQEKDLTFRLVGANFTATEQVFNLGSLTVSGMTDLLVVAAVELPSENTDLFFRYTRTTGETFTLAAGQGVQFAASINDTMQVQAILRGTATESPVLYTGVQSVVGSLDTSGFYQSRQFLVGSGGNTMRVIFDALVPGSSTVVPQYDKNGFQNMTLLKATPIGDGYVEYVYQDTGIVGLSASKVKLNLTGTAAHRPKVRNIRAVMV